MDGRRFPSHLRPAQSATRGAVALATALGSAVGRRGDGGHRVRRRRDDSNCDSNAATHRASVAHDDTRDQRARACRPARCSELIKKRSLVQVHPGPPSKQPRPQARHHSHSLRSGGSATGGRRPRGPIAGPVCAGHYARSRCWPEARHMLQRSARRSDAGTRGLRHPPRGCPRAGPGHQCAGGVLPAVPPRTRAGRVHRPC